MKSAERDGTIASTAHLILLIAHALVDTPDAATVDMAVLDNEVSVTVRVAPGERMSMVGSHGVILLAIRAVLGAVNRKTPYKFSLSVEENSDSVAVPG